MSEQLRQALVEFLNLQGEVAYPNAGVTIYSDSLDGLTIAWKNPSSAVQYYSPEAQELAQFLLEYTIV